MAEVGGLLYVMYVFGNVIMHYYSNWASKSLLARFMVHFQPMEEAKDDKDKKDLQKKKQNFVDKYGVTPKDPKRKNL